MNKPTVILLVAMSSDGFIAPLNKEKLPSTSWTSPEDKQFFTAQSKAIGTLIMGSKTFETIGRVLPDRRMIVMTSKPAHYAPYRDPNLVFTDESPEAILTDLSQQGIRQVALCGGARIYQLFLQKNLVDKMLITVEPHVFNEGIKLFTGAIEAKFKLLAKTKLNEQGTLLLEYSL